MAASKRRPKKNLSAAALERQRKAAEAAEREHKAGEVMAMYAAEPHMKVSEICRRSGLSRHVVSGILAKMQRDYLPATLELRKVSQEQIRALTDDRLVTGLEAMTPEKFKTAGLRDQAFAVDRLNNMRQLFRGEPTSILSIEDRRKMNELGAALLLEMQRRGITLEGEVTDVTTGP